MATPHSPYKAYPTQLLRQGDNPAVGLDLRDIASAPKLGAAWPVPVGGSSRRAWQSLIVLADVIGLAVSLAVGAVLRQPFGLREGPAVASSIEHELVFIPVFLMTMAMYGLYLKDRRRIRTTSFLDISAFAHALGLGTIVTLALSSAADRLLSWPKIGWAEGVFMAAPAVALIPLARGVACLVLSRNPQNRTRVVIVGSGAVAGSVAQRIRRCADIELIGFVDDEPDPHPGAPFGVRLGTISDLPGICTSRDVDRVLVAFSQTSPSWLMESLRELPPRARISVVPRLFELVTWQSRIEEIHGLTVMDVAPSGLGWASRVLKRAMDITLSTVALVLLSPAVLAVAVAVKVSSPGPVFFRQERVGYQGRIFRIVKFRTMTDGADEVQVDLRDHNDVDGPLFKLHNDPRVTTLGRLLRSTSLDEIPQLFNVLIGNMSLIGPRPFVPRESAGINGWAARRFDVRPGMTGLWQISGRNDLPFEELCQLDYAYVASWSLWWDLKILWHTPGSVIRRHGAY